MTRQGMFGTASGIVRHEGFFKLWQGVSPAILRHVIYSGEPWRRTCVWLLAFLSPVLELIVQPLSSARPFCLPLGLRMSIYEYVRDHMFGVQPDGVLAPSKALAGIPLPCRRLLARGQHQDILLTQRQHPNPLHTFQPASSLVPPRSWLPRPRTLSRCVLVGDWRGLCLL